VSLLEIIQNVVSPGQNLALSTLVRLIGGNTEYKGKRKGKQLQNEILTTLYEHQDEFILAGKGGKLTVGVKTSKIKIIGQIDLSKKGK